jgi:membrane protease YdiL (CAAX protease family)
VGLAVGFLLSAAAAGVAEELTNYRSSSNAPLPVAVTAADVSGLWLGLIGAVIYASRSRGSGSVVRDFGFKVGTWWDLPLGAAVGLACQYGVIPLVYLPFRHVDRSLTQQLGQPAQRDTAAAHGSVSIAILLLFIAVGAPVVEELFFRGLLLRSLLQRTRPFVAIPISAVIFGLAHFEALQFAGLSIFGLALGVLVWRTRRLGPSIGAHVAFNAAAVATLVHIH